MAKYLKLASLTGNPLYVYDSRYQSDTSNYEADLIKLSGIDKYVFMDDDETKVFSVFANWIPTTCSINLKLQFNPLLLSKDFSLFGYGNDLNLSNSWGLFVKENKFQLLISNGLNYLTIVFPSFTFDNNFDFAKKYNLTFIQNAKTATIYLDNKKIDSIELPFSLVSSQINSKIFIGSLGDITRYDAFMGKVFEVGIWDRELFNEEIQDLSNFRIQDNPALQTNVKKIKIYQGKIYYEGMFHNVPESSVYIQCQGLETVDLCINEKIITENDDPDLLDSSVDYFNFNRPGAHRLSYEYYVVRNANPQDYDIVITLLKFLDGVKIFDLLEEQNGKAESNVVVPTPESLPDNLAEIVMDITGNFVVEGLDVSMVQGVDKYTLTLNPGKYYLNGKKYQLSSSRTFDIPKQFQTQKVYGEPVKYVENDTYRVNKQPLTKSTSPEIILPVVERNVMITKGIPGGQDSIQGFSNIIKLLKVQDTMTYLEDGNTSITPSCQITGNKIDWSLPGNEPSEGSTYTADFIYNKLLIEGKDYYRCLGNKVQKEIVSYNGSNLYTVYYEPEYIVRIKNGSMVFDNDDVVITGKTISFKNHSSLNNTQPVEIIYSFSSHSFFKNKWSIYFEPTSNEFNANYWGYINYDYDLADIYTLAIFGNNSIGLVKGLSGNLDTVSKANIDKNSLPIADILIDSSSFSENNSIKKYEWNRTPISQVVENLRRTERLEERVILSSLETEASSYASADILKGTFTDSLADYNYSNIYHPEFTGHIDMIDSLGNLCSGLEKKVFQTIGNTNSRFKEFGYMPITSQPNNETIQISDVLKFGSNTESTFKSISVYNDYDYISESNDQWPQKFVDNILFNRRPIIPSTINTQSTNGMDIQNQSYLKSISEKLNKMVQWSSFKMNDKELILIGINYNSSETNLSVLVDNKEVILEQVSLMFDNIRQQFYVPNVKTTTSTNKTVYIYEPIQSGSGWTVQNNKITCNLNGEFVVKVKLEGLNIATGLVELKVVDVSQNKSSVMINCSGINNKVKNILTNNKRMDDSIFGVSPYMNQSNPFYVQPFKVSQSMILNNVSILSTFLDFSRSITISVQEFENNKPGKILTQKIISKESDVSITNVIDSLTPIQKMNIIFNQPVILRPDQTYCIGINSSSPSLNVGIIQKGQPSIFNNLMITNLTQKYPLRQLLDEDSYKVLENMELSFNLGVSSISAPVVSGFYQSEIVFNEIEFQPSDRGYHFSVLIDDLNYFDNQTKVDYYYSVETESTPAGVYGTIWEQFLPYTVIQNNSKIIKLQIKAVLKTKNINYSPSVHLYPSVVIYKYKSSSSYISKAFELFENNADNVKIYFDAYLPTDNLLKIYVSPNDSNDWREIDYSNEISKSNGTFAKFTYLTKLSLLKPNILEISKDGSGSLTGKYYYRVALLDRDGFEIGSELIEIDGCSNNSVKLKVQPDKNMYGFRVYRGITSIQQNQIYDSTVHALLIQNLDNQSTTVFLDTNKLVDFPNSGKIRIDNEIMSFTKSGNALTVVRGSDSTRIEKHDANGVREAYLWDHGTIIQESLNGQCPSLIQDGNFFYFNFVDNGSRYSANTTKTFIPSATNQTSIYPKYILVKVQMINNLLKDTPLIKNLIVNALV